jgi:PHD/YefM family antitoxin component YafN of YafNO toxin-antitoxin module
MKMAEKKKGVAKDPVVVLVNAREQRVLVKEDRASIRETAEILEDETAAASVRKGIKQLKQGKTIPWEQVKRDLGL